jgi:GntR family transcriptional regulator
MQTVKQQVSENVTQQILYEIQNGIYANADRLPPETEIAKRFGVSRTAIRDGLAVLEREGFISRKHGWGTMINKHVLKVRTRMDLEKEFLELIAEAGYQAKGIVLQTDFVEASEEIAAKLSVNPGDHLIRSIRVITADERPAIYAVDYIAEKNVIHKSYDMKEFEKPIFEFIQKYCETEVTMDLSEVRAVAAPQEVANAFGIEKGRPTLYMDEIGYNFVGQPILYSEEYYLDGVLKHTILRKKI